MAAPRILVCIYNVAHHVILTGCHLTGRRNTATSGSPAFRLSAALAVLETKIFHRGAQRDCLVKRRFHAFAYQQHRGAWYMQRLGKSVLPAFTPEKPSRAPDNPCNFRSEVACRRHFRNGRHARFINMIPYANRVMPGKNRGINELCNIPSCRISVYCRYSRDSRRFPEALLTCILSDYSYLCA